MVPVRNYERKTSDTYTHEDLQLAMEDVNNEGGLSVYAAAKKYGIPYETLRRWVNPQMTPSRQKAGRHTVLTEQEERYIVEALKYTALCGYPMNRPDLLYMVSSYINSIGRKTPFKDGKPGCEWARLFEKRWEKELSKRKPELLTKARAEGLSQINEFFRIYTETLKKLNLEGNPERIFNLDETGLNTNPLLKKVFVPKSSRFTYRKTQYSVLFCVNAVGTYYPPLVVYKGKSTLQDTWTKLGPNGATYATTPSGWMQDYAFENWFRKFISDVQDIEKPILITFDGHGSHLTYNTVKMAIDNNITLLCLPPNTSHALQALDVGVFGPLKTEWKIILRNWFRESRMKNVDKAVFPSLLRKLCASLNAEHAISGFKGTGLYPVNKDAIKHRIVHSTSLEQATPASGEQQPSTSVATRPAISTDETPSVSGLSFANQQSSSTVTASPSISQNSANSPFKILRQAILQTISPTQSADTIAALKNARSKRKRVQGVPGEVLTADEVANRLRKEEEERSAKKARKSKNKGLGSKSKNKRVIELESETSSEEEQFLDESNSDDLDVPEPIKVGAWVAIDFQSMDGTTVKEYRGQVVSIDIRRRN